MLFCVCNTSLKWLGFHDFSITIAFNLMESCIFTFCCLFLSQFVFFFEEESVQNEIVINTLQLFSALLTSFQIYLNLIMFRIQRGLVLSIIIKRIITVAFDKDFCYLCCVFTMCYLPAYTTLWGFIFNIYCEFLCETNVRYFTCFKNNNYIHKFIVLLKWEYSVRVCVPTSVCGRKKRQRTCNSCAGYVLVSLHILYRLLLICLGWFVGNC